MFDDTYELVEKQDNGASNSTVIVDLDGLCGDGDGDNGDGVTVVLNSAV